MCTRECVKEHRCGMFSRLCSGPAHSGGGGPASVHGEAQLWKWAAVLLWSGFPVKVSVCVCVHICALVSIIFMSVLRRVCSCTFVLIHFDFSCSKNLMVTFWVCVRMCRCCLLQADSDRQQQAWISAVQNSIASAFQERREDTHSPVRITHTHKTL